DAYSCGRAMREGIALTIKRFVPWLAVMLLFTSLAGCMQPSKPASEPGGAASHNLVLAVGNEPDAGFDPTTGWGRYGSPLFQSTLLRYDHELRVEHDLAAGYHVSGDGLEWTVELRRDAKFSDGTPVTAEDVR